MVVHYSAEADLYILTHNGGMIKIALPIDEWPLLVLIHLYGTTPNQYCDWILLFAKQPWIINV